MRVKIQFQNYLHHNLFLAMNLGAESTQSLITEGEKDIIFEACKSENEEVAIKNIEHLCEEIEKEMLKENKKLDIADKKEEELDLQEVNLGFDSDSEGSEYESQDRDSNSQLDVSRDRTDTLNSTNFLELRDSVQGKMLSLTGKGSDETKIRLLEDAKDTLLEAVENLTQATERVDKLKVKYEKDSAIGKSSKLLFETINGITKTCMFIEKIESENKKSLRNFE